jgi:DNA-binding MarR family transcriptional regulator
MQNINEKLLNAWLKLSTSICNERIVSELPYNESLICGILHENATEHPEEKMTATDLCEKTNIQKSQMNRILNALEEKGLIFRKRSEKDKRQVFVSFNMENAEVYERQHKNILRVVDDIIEKVGKEKADEIVQLFTLISNKAKEVINRD